KAQLGEQVGHVALDGVIAQAQPRRDVRIAQALGDEAQHLELPAGKPWLAARPFRSGRSLLPGAPGVALRAQRLERRQRLARTASSSAPARIVGSVSPTCARKRSSSAAASAAAPRSMASAA